MLFSHRFLSLTRCAPRGSERAGFFPDGLFVVSEGRENFIFPFFLTDEEKKREKRWKRIWPIGHNQNNRVAAAAGPLKIFDLLRVPLSFRYLFPFLEISLPSFLLFPCPIGFAPLPPSLPSLLHLLFEFIFRRQCGASFTSP